MTKFFAEYYEADELKIKNELDSPQSLNADIERTKPLLQRPFTVVVVKETREEITTRIYKEK